MARENLAARSHEGQITITAKIERYAHKTADTYLLTNICDAATGQVLTDHLWIKIGKWAEGFRQGDLIELTAKVAPYLKGWLGDALSAPPEASRPSIDWTLSEPSDARVLKFGPITRMMPDGRVMGLKEKGGSK